MHGSTRLNVLYEMLVKKGGGLRIATNTGTLSAVPGTLPNFARSCKSSARGSDPIFLKRETFNHKREASPRIKGKNSTCDGLRMTNNSGMLMQFLELFQSWQEAGVFC